MTRCARPKLFKSENSCVQKGKLLTDTDLLISTEMRMKKIYMVWTI